MSNRFSGATSRTATRLPGRRSPSGHAVSGHFGSILALLFLNDAARDSAQKLLAFFGLATEGCANATALVGLRARCRGQLEAKRVAQGVADGVDFGVQPAAIYANRSRAVFLSSGARLMSLAGGGVDHGLLNARLLDGLTNGLEMSLVAAVGEALIDVVSAAKLLEKVAPWGAGVGDPRDGADELALIAAEALGDGKVPLLVGQAWRFAVMKMVARLSQQL